MAYSFNAEIKQISFEMVFFLGGFFFFFFWLQLMSISLDVMVAVCIRVSEADMVSKPSKAGGDDLRF